MLVSAFLLVFSFNCCVFGANVLMVYDLPSPSHQLWVYSLAEGLMAKGYNITILGPFANKGKSSDIYHPLVIEGVLDVVAKNEDFDFERGTSKLNIFQFLTVLTDYTLTVCNHSYHTNGFRTLINYPKDFKFDLIIIDVTTGPCLHPLIQRFGYPPTIGVTALFLQPSISRNFGNSIHPSYLPVPYSEYTETMSFFQRVSNYILTYIEIFIMKPLERRQIEKIAKGVLGENLDPIEKLQNHVSLLLCNLNPSIIYPQPLTPNIIPVGGLHIKQAKQLPKDLTTIMDKAKDGVILFALGTNIRSDNLNEIVRRNLLEAFAKLKQTVIWKFESELDNLPKNIIIRNWLPQNDILAHPNTKLFISHGGALSTFEAIYHGVPIIGMPFFLDQVLNINSMVEKKLALKINVRNFTSNELFKGVTEVLTNPLYLKHIKEYSRRMRDQPQTPLERAVFWAEYAMRHNGAHFMNPKSRDMSHFASSSLDVILFLISVMVFTVSVIFVVLKKMRLCFRARLAKKEKLN